MKRTLLTTATAIFTSTVIWAADVYVSPSGRDSNNGTSPETAKATLTSALRQAREMRRLNAPGVEEGVTIHMADGVYPLYEPVFVRPEDSGTPTSPTVITSTGGACLSGGVRIDGWK
ncbi:MAG: right-handed parallel beta-helix repeat-containing protein, partial [Duncaniella sp.]|nr:right-handed parallel beta-helix repeat-containing protein [Duncaniella sp.]